MFHEGVALCSQVRHAAKGLLSAVGFGHHSVVPWPAF